MKKLLLFAPLLILAVACSNATPAPATSVPTPVPPAATVSDPYVPPTPAPPFTPMPPMPPTPNAGATTTARLNATAIAWLEATAVSAWETAQAPSPTPVVIVETLTDEELDEWMCLERVSGTGTDTPGKIAGVTIVHEGVYWLAFDCGRFVE